MLDLDTYSSLDGVGLATEIRKRQFSAVEVMDCAIQQAESLNPSLNAICWQSFEQARETAFSIDQDPELRTAPLAGVPFLVKDISPVKGLPQTNQSRLFQGEVAEANAIIVEKFLESGLVPLGKSNTPELCLTITTESRAGGVCHNPWNPDHSCGGSSGGSAAAVAAGIVPIAHATDGGGSIRIPASCCGVFGLKPSRGLTPVAPDLAASWSGMSVAHVVSRSVRDSAAVLDCIKLRKPGLYPLPGVSGKLLEKITEKPALRIAVQREHPLGAELHPEVVRAVNTAVDYCSQLGFEIFEKNPPIDYRELAASTGTIIHCHVAQNILPQLTATGESLDTELLEEATRRMARRGAELSALDYLAAMDSIHAIAAEMDAFHRQFDILLSPVLSQPPAPLGWLNMDSADIGTYVRRFSTYSGFCSLFNATGQPSMSVPIHVTSDNLPIGVMFSARWGADSQLLQLAYQLEQIHPWRFDRLY